MYNYIKQKYLKIYGSNLLYIGLRGSRALNIYTNNSDYDVLIITKDNTSELCIQNDCMVFQSRYIKNHYQNFDFEIFEAILNPIYIAKEYTQEYNKIYNLYTNRNPELDKLFKFQIFKMIKNQLKQIHKNTDLQTINKFKAKSWLYYNIFIDTNQARRYWVMKNLLNFTNDYILIKTGKKEININEIHKLRYNKNIKQKLQKEFDYIKLQIGETI